MQQVHFRQFAPSPALAAVVQCFWTLGTAQADGSPAQWFEERVFPDGRTSFLFSYGAGFGIDGRPPPGGGLAETTTSRAMSMALSAQGRTVGVRLQPGGLHALFGVDAQALNDRLIPLADLAPATAPGVYERIGEAATPAAQVACAQRWCLGLLACQRGIAPAVRFTRDAIVACHGQVAVGELARAAGIGTRQLERLYRRQIGVSPAALARLSRAAHARTLIEHRSELALVEVAHAAGYCDQPHFTRDFKRATGLPPGAYRVWVLARSDARAGDGRESAGRENGRHSLPTPFMTP